MSLIVEDGTGLANAESYASVSDADTYWVAMNDASWAPLSTSVKEAALRRATQYLDSHFTFVGDQTTLYYNSTLGQYVATQALQWPRTFRNTWPLLPLRAATAELANEYVKNGTLYADVTQGDVIEEKVGPINVKYNPTGLNGATIYQLVEDMLSAAGFVVGNSSTGHLVMA